MAACVRSLAPSLARMFLTRPLTVSSVTDELRGDLFIGIPAGNQPEDIDLRRSQGLIGGMLGQLNRMPRRKASSFRRGRRGSSPGVPYPAAFFSRYARAPAFMARRTWTSPVYVVSTMMRASGKFAANRDHRIQAVHLAASADPSK